MQMVSEDLIVVQIFHFIIYIDIVFLQNLPPKMINNG